jgi:acylphosphatase
VIRKRVVVHGQVQGVFFRAECARMAERLGVRGFISNQPDGTVYAEFEGHSRDVEQLLAWCHAGPRQARVERVDATDIAPSGAAGFHVL